MSRDTRRTPIYKDFVLIQLATLIFVIDQLSKFVVRDQLHYLESFPATGFFRFTHTFNTGSAFGIFQNQNTPLIFVSIIGIGILILVVGGRAVLSGDTAYFEPLIAFAKGADLLVHEALLEAGVDALCAGLNLTDGRLKRHLMQSHTTAQEAGRIASLAGVDHLALTHFVPGADPSLTPALWEAAVRETWQGQLSLGQDGMRIAV